MNRSVEQRLERSSGAQGVGWGVIDAINRHALERPEAEAVGELDGARGRCTFGELAGLVSSRTQQLRGSLDPGDVLIAVLPAGTEFAAWFCAAIAAGLRFLPMHPQIAGPEALAAATRAGAVAALVGPGLEAEPALSHLALGLGVNRNALVPTAHGSLVLGSSGTTGLPKLVVRTSESLDADAAGVIAGMGLTAADRIVFPTSLSHSYGVDVLVGALTAGAGLRVMGQFDAEYVARELEEGATVLPGVPFVFEALARRERTRPTALRLAVSAGSPLPDPVRRGFAAAWGADIGQLYGATELGTVAIDAPGSDGFDPASVGRPLAGVSIRIVDIADPSRLLPTGQEGQLAVRAASMLSEYLDGDVPLVDGYLLTGDLARTDAIGRIWITGRLKHLIDVGGFKVNPLEVERVLATHPGVAECVVVPVAASQTVQRLRAVVVPCADQPPTPDELRRYVRARLSSVKVPRSIELSASLPKSATGKVLRHLV
ncbi:MAG: long-chain fatty acid--CoA ligase [Phycisphaeraceae bacterium]|nr:long-chain fatty acid--CoA ligase [Phycisphaeraceae bacterium]